MPEHLFLKLCKGMLFTHLPPQSVVCEEDDAGDSMYILMSGTCLVRGKPPPEKPAANVAEVVHRGASMISVGGSGITPAKAVSHTAPHVRTCPVAERVCAPACDLR